MIHLCRGTEYIFPQSPGGCRYPAVDMGCGLGRSTSATPAIASGTPPTRLNLHRAVERNGAVIGVIESYELRHMRGSGQQRRPWARATHSEIVARDAELSHHGVESGPVEPQTRGGRGDHPAAVPQHPHHMLPLHLLERGAAGGFQRILLYFG